MPWGRVARLAGTFAGAAGCCARAKAPKHELRADSEEPPSASMPLRRRRGRGGGSEGDPRRDSIPYAFTEQGAFSIIEPYLRLASLGRRILPFRVGGCLWIDVGRPADLERANRLLARTP